MAFGVEVRNYDPIEDPRGTRSGRRAKSMSARFNCEVVSPRCQMGSEHRCSVRSTTGSLI
jgi:hypothetical protein